MSEWKEYKLEDIVEKFIDYRGKTPQKTNKGIPLITAKIVKNGRIEKPDEFISKIISVRLKMNIAFRRIFPVV